ncbi:MAG: ROK family protein [Candidatus Aminicenantia bacterium]
MWEKIKNIARPKIVPPLDNEFIPAVKWLKAFSEMVKNSKNLPVKIGVNRNDGSLSVFETEIMQSSEFEEINIYYIERILKFLLWQKGGFKVLIGGEKKICDELRKMYSLKGERAFDAKIMSKVYERNFEFEFVELDKFPPQKEVSVPVDRDFKGCRIGFDLGGSDRKVSAVIDGKPVFTEEVPWEPQLRSNPNYHFHQIMSALHSAASHLPRVDAIGGSSAGIYINNRVMVASLFRAISDEVFEKRVKNIFLDIQRAWNVPLVLMNDGEVTALAGSMSLNVNKVLGIAMGSSQAGGYVDGDGNLTNWLNELAFAPVDLNDSAPVDEWSEDKGCGVSYLSQQAVFRLAKIAGINLEGENYVERLKNVQYLFEKGEEKARRIFETIGVYLGYGIAMYSNFYDISNVLILGRVISGKAGLTITEKAKEVLDSEFPELYKRIKIHFPDEKWKRLGQAIVAASLPVLKDKN